MVSVVRRPAIYGVFLKKGVSWRLSYIRSNVILIRVRRALGRAWPMAIERRSRSRLAHLQAGITEACLSRDRAGTYRSGEYVQ